MLKKVCFVEDICLYLPSDSNKVMYNLSQILSHSEAGNNRFGTYLAKLDRAGGGAIHGGCM
jgi:hypothetical protein